MKLAELIEHAKAGAVGLVTVDEAFDAEHGAMNQTSTYGPGLVDLDTFRTLRSPRPHQAPEPGFAGDHTSFSPVVTEGRTLSQHRSTQSKDGLK